MDVGLFQVLDPDYTTSVTLVWMLDCLGFRSRLNNIRLFSLDVGLFQVSDPEGKGRGTQGRGPSWGNMQVTSSVAKPVSGRKWR